LINSKKSKAAYEESHKEGWRLKGSNAFKPLELQLLRVAWQWRDKEAQRRDCASYRILNPYLMMDIVKAAAKIKGKISENNLPKLPRNIKGRLLQSFLGTLNEAIAAPASKFPSPLPRQPAPRTAINEDLRELLRELRNEKAAQLRIDSGLLAKQAQLNVLADSLNGSWEEKFKVAEFMNWQCEIWESLVPRAILPKTPTELRAWAKERVLAMSAESMAKESEKLLAKLFQHPVLEMGFIAAFYPTDLEPQIVPFIKKLADEGRLLLPRTLDKQSMDFVLVQNLETDLQLGAFGIMEPKPELPTFEDMPIAFVVPGVVFGKDGGRMGHGAGYYDRFLSSFKGIPKIGLAYSAQIRSLLPQKATDVRMDEVMWAKS
jgi:5-formyltetrahydrofolate cyclo-ligase